MQERERSKALHAVGLQLHFPLQEGSRTRGRPLSNASESPHYHKDCGAAADLFTRKPPPPPSPTGGKTNLGQSLLLNEFYSHKLLPFPLQRQLPSTPPSPWPGTPPHSGSDWLRSLTLQHPCSPIGWSCSATLRLAGLQEVLFLWDGCCGAQEDLCAHREMPTNLSRAGWTPGPHIGTGAADGSSSQRLWQPGNHSHRHQRRVVHATCQFEVAMLSEVCSEEPDVASLREEARGGGAAEQLYIEQRFAPECHQHSPSHLSPRQVDVGLWSTASDDMLSLVAGSLLGLGGGCFLEVGLPTSSSPPPPPPFPPPTEWRDWERTEKPCPQARA
ncbi:hypothetical protein EYF80_048164 [Liparis tanakae]|uniref:Uncharacterized protein n=1 Tax=Liparis tanakae TaxID=230148 RepID=A0A4Z2FKA0_9TELE|nr:hypothetical protein EYF80_048164 [Liparis tanakae]